MDDGGPANGPLDKRDDPDRFDPDREPDPDQDRTLPELLGSGAHEEDRIGVEWLAGLIAVILFLALFVFLFGKVLNPA